ncbi:MAG: hypothetical protein LH477_15480 [Nocardioides sp.]|nr:hypothetical protein [Nocardioides sp.]
MALQAPIERSTHLALRAAVLDLVEGEHRRHFPTVLHAGLPGGRVQHVADGAGTGAVDPGLRADIALALLRRAGASTPRPRVWLTRPGELSVHDEDLLWLGPVTWAAAALGQHTSLVVVTRRGWFDPVSGVRREWRRLRRR